ncbi:MAG: flagellar motor protein MotB [Deltaproteobacteria bacterium]|nr:flagellar motor protein MotB [Deltaproteobacteria bacterium]
MAKRQHHEEHENHERWLVSYADFITLLFAFFVVMYATSRVDRKKTIDAEKSIKFAMHFKGTGGLKELPIFSGPPTDSSVLHSPLQGKEKPRFIDDTRLVESLRKRLQRKLTSFLQERPDKMKSVVIDTEGKRLIVRLSAASFFDPAQAAIRPQMLPVLDAIASELTALKRHIRVGGHTDDSRLTGRFRDNWELSASRAAAVASYIQRAFRYDGTLLSAVGFADTIPRASNKTPDGREANRRVEMVIEVNPGESLHTLSH